ncbi:MAG: hypothetical protein LH475_03325 [Cryobacterium sp.]|uniref:hypothetical protein n=1 Tax=unclassified Cryobacterium TaxID=2649013 RepID=UPI0018CA5CB0|nr:MULTISPECIES: hypothetical protein [unclassified Cryobacterium]MCY7403654.1 hypothetical protein [Cryobacterium sp.]MEC5155642.1 hypothetical protein [Cryobacterium sp. CAN_C3]
MTFDVRYPERLSRWKVLVTSRLLALPHPVIVAVLAGGSSAACNGQPVGGLLALLVFIVALFLLFTKVYGFGLFNLIMGINRGIYRVLACTSLLRDEYPPFRLVQGTLECPALLHPTPKGLN